MDIKNIVKKKLQNIDDEDLKAKLLSIFNSFIDYTDGELQNIKNHVNQELVSYSNAQNFEKDYLIQQVLVEKNEDVPAGFFNMYNNHKELILNNENKFEIELTGNSVSIPVLVFTEEDVQNIEKYFSDKSASSSIEIKSIKIERDISFINKIIEMKNLFHNNHIKWSIPYLPYSQKLYNIILEIDNKAEKPSLTIDKSILNKCKVIICPLIFWNVEEIKKEEPRLGKEHYNEKQFYSYSIKTPQNTGVLLKSKFYSKNKEKDKMIIRISKKENQCYDYYLIHNELIAQDLGNIRSNEMNENCFLPFSYIRTKADFEVYFNTFKHINDLSLSKIYISKEITGKPEKD